ncbi:hypothetical protein MCNS_00400 [Mycobacterium conspicuum]|jgi:hypothetical protein|uniref:Uncharacterized protein n=2 Tax=Mycobacterium conspicuum TaxID=44010 RepID=A0A1X1T476_9MYCO|nr:hypothetical protein [Mycobacterium conspicuum]ORV39325.1 hypothetical protein AWC00_18295 [Mycobacterium conspicuum]BBZ36977.1 hypothetical protein MCNS_00400 [Mycobacterium conspicuum]
MPLLAVAVIVVSSDIRMPIGLPGHRGLVWLTVLVAVAVATPRRLTVVAVGAASTIATFAAHLSPGTGSARYLAAAILLYAVASTAAVRRRRWLIVLAAAPIHLVALADSLAVLLGRAGMVEKGLFHLGFGLAAGLLGWAIGSASTGVRRHRDIRDGTDERTQ